MNDLLCRSCAAPPPTIETGVAAITGSEVISAEDEWGPLPEDGHRCQQSLPAGCQERCLIQKMALK